MYTMVNHLPKLSETERRIFCGLNGPFEHIAMYAVRGSTKLSTGTRMFKHGIYVLPIAKDVVI